MQIQPGLLIPEMECNIWETGANTALNMVEFSVV